MKSFISTLRAGDMQGTRFVMIYTTCVYYSTVLYFIKYFFFFFGHAALPLWHALARIIFGTRWHVFFLARVGTSFWHALARLSLARVAGTSLFGTKNRCHLTTHRVYSSLIRCFLEVRPDQELTPPISAKLHMGPKSFGTNWHKLFWHALAPLWHHLAQRIYLCRC